VNPIGSVQETERRSLNFDEFWARRSNELYSLRVRHIMSLVPTSIHWSSSRLVEAEVWFWRLLINKVHSQGCSDARGYSSCRQWLSDGEVRFGSVQRGFSRTLN
jgi:hypothetical protein